jgi:hypothetical protein
MSGTIPRQRSHHPVLLVDQITAWVNYRAGWSVNHISLKLKRSPTEARAILRGGAA